MIFYIIPEIRYAIGLVELSPEPMMIITGHDHPAIALLRKQGIEVWCAEEKGKETSYHAPGLLRLSAVQKMILDCPAKKRKLLTFKISPQFTALATKLEAEILMPSFKLNRFWEDKSRGMEALAEAKVPVKESVTGTLRSLDYGKVKKALKAKKLVVQKPHGMAGNNTFFINTEKEWRKLSVTIGANPLVKVSPYLDGMPYTVNCFLSATGKVSVSYPMLQITGDENFTRYPGGTSGVDMTGVEKFKKSFLSKLTKIAENIAKTMHKTEFWGWFGVDFLVDQDDLTVLEINPRFTASISLFTQAQHIQLKHSFWEEYLSGKAKKTDWMQPLPYTTLLLRNITLDNQTLVEHLVPGIYVWKKDMLELKQKTVLLADLKAADEYLIVTKGKDSVIHSDGEMATIVAPRSATKNGGIDKELQRVASFVQKVLLGVDQKV